MHAPSVPIALLLLAAAVPAQQLLLPDNHHLCENVNQLGNVGSIEWWRTTAGRFQVLYEASHFLGAGVTGPIVIERLRFRGEDGEMNLGGQVYTGVTVELGSTSLNTATMNTTTFGANRTPALPDTTTMGPLGTATVTVLPSSGSVPNNWFIDIDLVAAGAAFTFDPTGAEPNLLVDITLPNPPANAPPLALIATQNTTGGVAGVRGRGITTPTPGSLTGTASTAPPVIGLQFTGAGGEPTLVPARNEFYGGACGGAPSAFYEGFLNGQPFDLTGLTLFPDNPGAPTRYTVVNTAPPVDLTQVTAAAASTLDDAVVVHALGFNFAHPGGSTPTIVASTNGFVWLDATMTDSQFAPVVARFLGDGVAAGTHSGARLAIYWHDLNCGRNLGLNTNAGLHLMNDTSGGPGNTVCYITWWDIGEFNVVNGAGIFGHAVTTFQMVLFEATGVVEFRYGAMPPFAASSITTANSHASLVGYSQGRIGGVGGLNSVNPQNRDLSLEAPFVTFVEGTTGNMGQTAVATPVAGGPQYSGRMFPGQSLTWNVSEVPAGTILGAQLIDIAASRPGLQLPTITAPGCMLSTSGSATLWEINVLPGSTVTGTVPFVVPPGFSGVDVYAQYVVLGGLFGGPDLISSSSNALKHTIGLR